MNRTWTILLAATAAAVGASADTAAAQSIAPAPGQSFNQANSAPIFQLNAAQLQQMQIDVARSTTATAPAPPRWQTLQATQNQILHVAQAVTVGVPKTANQPFTAPGGLIRGTPTPSPPPPALPAGFRPTQTSLTLPSGSPTIVPPR